MRKRKWILLILTILMIALSIPELLHKNKGSSKSLGSVGNGQLENPYLLPWSGKNFRYFSPISYFIFDNGYTHSKVHNTLLEAYKICEQTCPGIQFRVMECSDKKGGKLMIHRTHQNGMSIDFMSPKKKPGQQQNGKDKQSKLFDLLGMWHYLLEFSNAGKLNGSKKISIDFETMGQHILALDKAARNNGLRIKKVIFKIELKGDFYTPSGKKVQQKGIYFARALPPFTNKVHDDHYHVDFEIIR